MFDALATLFYVGCLLALAGLVIAFTPLLLVGAVVFFAVVAIVSFLSAIIRSL